MNERREVRASDSDRQAAVERLRAALDEGRLNLFEYDDRLARAYQAVTYGDLADLFVDLPKPGTVSKLDAPPVAPARRVASSPGVVTGLPLALKILWTIWLGVMLINVTVWLLTSVSNGEIDNFWPIWFLVPGAALLGVSVGVTAIMRSRRSAQLAKALAAERRRREIR
jgi:hypothetical protein